MAPSEPAPRAATPRGARTLVLVLAPIALLALALSLVAIARAPPSGAALATAGGLALLLYALQRSGFVVHWRGQRVASTLDEPVIMLALLLVPPALVVPITLMGTGAAQLAARRAPVKAAFNVATHAVSAGGATLALLVLDLHPLVAAPLATAAYSILNHAASSILFATLERANPLRIYRERFLHPTLLHVGLTSSVVLALVGLWALHPAATLALIPLMYLALRFIDLNARADRQVLVYKRLAQMQRLAATTPREDAIADDVLDACGELFLAGEARLTLHARGAHPARAWSRAFESGPAPRAKPVQVPLVGAGGTPLGTLHLRRAQRTRERRLEADEPLLRILAGEAATALEAVWALDEVVELQELNDRILGHAPAGIALVDAEGRVQRINDLLARALGASDAAARSAHVTEIAGFREHPELCARILAVAKGVPFADVEWSPRDGVTFAVSGVPLPPSERGLRGSVVLFSDVTARKFAEDALRSHSLTRPLVRRIVLDLVRSLGASRVSLAQIGRGLAAEADARTVQEFAAAFRTMGLGEVRLAERAGDVYTFQADDLLERREKATQPTCHLALGYLEGVVAILHKQGSLGSEIRCQSQGHERCTFLVKPRPIEPPPRARVASAEAGQMKFAPKIQSPSAVKNSMK